MLSKNNKILIGCLALLLVMSVGYALFSDTITINGSATAKGDFDITATCQTGIISKLGTSESLGLGAEGGYEDDSCSVTGDSVSLSTKFLYPGASRTFTIKITNDGSIDALYEPNKDITTEEFCVADDLEGNGLTCTTVPQKDGTMLLKGFYANMYVGAVAIEDFNGNLLSQSQLLEFYDPTTGNAILKPGYSAYFVANIWIGHDSSNSQGGVMNASYTSSKYFNFTQSTN